VSIRGQAIQRCEHVVARVEQTLLVALLLAMVGVASLQIFLRILFSSGIVWGDVALRHLVLWAGLVGAMLATRESRHIAIDIIPRILKGKASVLLGILSDFFSAFIGALLARAGFIFMRDEFLSQASTFLGLPAWVPVLIFPIAFFTITFHFILNGLARLTRLAESDQ
jgi:TRAP-type C4-dicarboxylate transport system permease small subunit